MSSRPSHYAGRAAIDLSARQEEILRLIAAGLTNAQIAERLGMTLDGAKWHVSEIIQKLGVSSRDEAVARWRSETSLGRRAARFAHGFVGLKILHWGMVTVGTATVGVGVAWATISAWGGSESGAPMAEQAVVEAPTPVASAAPASFPTADPAVACKDGDLLIASDSQIENGALVFTARITKPRHCDMTGPIEAFVVDAAAAGFDGTRLLTERTALLAPVGTDVVFITVTWRNWCRPVPPTPPLTPSRGAPVFPLANPLWLALSSQSGSGTGSLYPECSSPSSPTALTIATRAEPDPPVTPPPAAAPPSFASAADLERFARWFATIVAARDEATLTALSRPVDVTCPASIPSGPDQRYPLCKEAAPGQVLSGFVMSQSGQLGSAPPYESRRNQMTAASGQLRSAGCAADAPACERFVVVFEALPGGGPGTYYAFVFESVAGTTILRGLYPGGGDRDTVFGGGQAQTPWGETIFTSLR